MRHTKAMKINGHGMDTVSHMDPGTGLEPKEIIIGWLLQSGKTKKKINLNLSIQIAVFILTLFGLGEGSKMIPPEGFS